MAQWEPFSILSKTFFLKLYVKFKIGCAQFSKLCALKWVILAIKQHLVGRAVYIHQLFTGQELCFVFFCIYVIAVLFCLFLFSSLQMWVIFDFPDSLGLYCVFDFNSLTKIDRVFGSSDTKRTISTEEW